MSFHNRQVHPALRRAMNLLARQNERDDTSAIACRARLIARLNSCAENGQIGIYRSGMDCDCTSYVDERWVMVPHPIQFERDEDERARWLDGPESTSICRPSEIRNGYHASRDLALEAYEDGRSQIFFALPA